MEKEDWLESLDKDNREKADNLIIAFEKLGHPNPLYGTFMEMTDKNSAELARFRFLYGLKRSLNSDFDDPEKYVNDLIKHGYPDTKEVIKKMVDADISVNEIISVVKSFFWDGMYWTVQQIGDPDFDNLDRDKNIRFPKWSLQEVDEKGKLTGRGVYNLNDDMSWVKK
ncbi:hypothetical protein [Paenibacillus aceris]|uniref:Uncharacterized protein n=1 Tax=Paenibacillus aceris TaxID=869555 RepID=A0ABS4HQC8_9BACL|nr:hypothetical protein [Paenibacillus aceris]MBP1960808.1 hypothetical protein [Paenibacillus aceris]NHW35510.1 hypothetical protein [Paenibacillus aceris]